MQSFQLLLVESHMTGHMIVLLYTITDSLTLLSVIIGARSSLH